MLLFSTISDDGEKKRVRRKIFVTQKDELAWDPKKFRKQQLQDMYSSANDIRVEHVRDRKGAYEI
jgi:hypothetical protein